MLHQYLLIWTKLCIGTRVTMTALRPAPCLPTLGSLGISKVEMLFELPSLPLYWAPFSLILPTGTEQRP